MAFFVYGSAGRGVHSDAHYDGIKRSLRIPRVERTDHGPVKILMENGKLLNPPKMIPVRAEYTLES